VADRRRDKRYRLTEPTAGTLTVFPDATVRQGTNEEWIAMSREAAIRGETLVLDLLHMDADGDDHRQRVAVHVIDSQPVVVDGRVCHRVRLRGGGTMFPVYFEQQIRRG